MQKHTSTAALITAFIYIIFFQFFLSSGYYTFLYAGNIIFCIAVAVFMFSKQASVSSQFLPVLTGRGIRFSFTAATFSFTGCLLLGLINFYVFPDLKNSMGYFFKIDATNNGIVNLNDVAGLAVVNAFIANTVAGSLVSFLSAGIANEKNYQRNPTTLPSVKH